MHARGHTLALVVVATAMVSTRQSLATDPLGCSIASGTGHLSIPQGCGSGDLEQLKALLDACGGAGASDGLVCIGAGPDGSSNVIALNASMAFTPSERARVQSALMATRQEFTALSSGDNGAAPAWVVPIGGLITAVDTGRCAA